MNRIDRLLGTILLLQSRRVIMAEQVAAHFEVSVRTVYRDLSALSEIGVPIAAEAGVGYSLLKGYHLPPVMLTEVEASSLFVAGEMAKVFTDFSLSEPIESALLKIRAVLPAERRDQAERIVGHTAVVAQPRSPTQLASNVLLPIQQAVVLRRVLRLKYQARGRTRPTGREVEPLGVVYYGNAWYLIAWCRLRQDYRHFRLDRIRQLTVSDTAFAPRLDFSMLAHLEESVRKEERIPARIRFGPKAAERARTECFAGLVEERRIGNWVEMDFLTFSLKWLARWMLSFGNEAEAIEPARLRTLVRAEAERVANIYPQRRDGAGELHTSENNERQKVS